MPQIQELQRGLSSCGVLKAVVKSPELWRPMFQSGCKTEMTATLFLDDVVPIFSSSQRQKEVEIDVFKAFCDFVQTIGTAIGMLELYNVRAMSVPWTTCNCPSCIVRCAFHANKTSNSCPSQAVFVILVFSLVFIIKPL